MHPADIKALLEKARATYEDVARLAGVTSRSYVAHVLAGRVRGPKIEAAIAEITKTPLNRLWPDRYSRTRARKAA